MSSSPRCDWFDMKTFLFNARPERRAPSRLVEKMRETGRGGARRSKSRKQRTQFREVLDCGGKRSATPLSHGGSRSICARHSKSESGFAAALCHRTPRRYRAQKGLLFHARPHPGPLPRGEGESFAASFATLSLDLPRTLTKSLNRPIAVPSPGGEGQGEGGR
jgi:hypothetical protein